MLLRNLFRPTKAPQICHRRTFLKIINAYETGIRFNFGKFGTELKPGLRLCIPVFHTIRIVDMREMIHSIPMMQVISSDNVTFEVDAALQCRVTNGTDAILKVYGLRDAILEKCKMELRNILSSMTLNEILQNKSDLSKKLLERMNHQTNWGVEFNFAQIKDIKFDDSIKAAMMIVAEATRQAEAKIINAKADIETAKQYNEAAKIYAENPMTVRLREFQLWNSVSKNPGSTIFVVPSNLLESIGKKMND